MLNNKACLKQSSSLAVLERTYLLLLYYWLNVYNAAGLLALGNTEKQEEISPGKV